VLERRVLLQLALSLLGDEGRLTDGNIRLKVVDDNARFVVDFVTLQLTASPQIHATSAP